MSVSMLAGAIAAVVTPVPATSAGAGRSWPADRPLAHLVDQRAPALAVEDRAGQHAGGRAGAGEVRGVAVVPVVVGGIIPPEDERTLKAAGVARIYTPKDYDLTAIMSDIVELVDERGDKAA